MKVLELQAEGEKKALELRGEGEASRLKSIDTVAINPHTLAVLQLQGAPGHRGVQQRQGRRALRGDQPDGRGRGAAHDAAQGGHERAEHERRLAASTAAASPSAGAAGESPAAFAVGRHLGPEYGPNHLVMPCHVGLWYRAVVRT